MASNLYVNLGKGLPVCQHIETRSDSKIRCSEKLSSKIGETGPFERGPHASSRRAAAGGGGDDSGELPVVVVCALLSANDAPYAQD